MGKAFFADNFALESELFICTRNFNQSDRFDKYYNYFLNVAQMALEAWTKL